MPFVSNTDLTFNLSPSRFQTMATNPFPDLDPQLIAAFAKSAEIAASHGTPEPDIVAVRRNAEFVRVYWNDGGPTMAKVLRRTIAGPVRHVPVVAYYPRQVAKLLPVFVYLHGGGFKIGSEWSNDRQMREVADAWGGIVISADYAHAPEHVFPTAVEETTAVLEWLHNHGDTWGIDGERIGVGGNSAGANVAFGAAIGMGGVPWVRAGVAVAGAFSANTSSPTMRQYGDVGLFPDIASVRAIFDDYLPNPADRYDPRANPLLANPSLLPPCFLAAAEFDVFRDSSVVLAEMLANVGRLYALKIYPKMAHLFFGMSRSIDCAEKCTGDIGHFLAAILPA